MRKGIEELVLEFINNDHYSMMTRKEIANIFVEKKSEYKYIYDIIDKLDREGRINVTGQNVESILNSSKYFKGRISIKKKGFGFVQTDDEEFFISRTDRNGAYDGDYVLIKLNDDILPEDVYCDIYDEDMDLSHREARVIKILERNKHEFVGRLDYRKNNSYGFVITDDIRFDSDIFIPKKYMSGAKNGDKVVCRINNWSGNNPEGVITDVIGRCGSNEVEFLSIVKSFGLDTEFSSKVLNEVESISENILDEDISDRKDLRSELIYTIDGDDSKDFDDAISVKKLDDGNYVLGVHIADVTHYVREGTELDKEARSRATSVYLVDEVIPMLPKKLSNGLCSLNPNEDRLTLSCIMTVDRNNGRVVDYEICKSIINSKARMTYNEVSDFLESDEKIGFEKFELFRDSLFNARDLAEILFKKRVDRGCIEFDFEENKILLDDNKNPIDIKLYERRVSNKMIEEFMLLANETVAKHFCDMEIPFVYRVHEVPELEKMEVLKEFANSYNLGLKGDVKQIEPMDIQRLLNSIDDEITKKAVSMVVLRTLRQARYSPNNLEHFGLAATYYTHFTSPIRRYPDLQIHRIIKDVIDGQLNEKKISHYNSLIEDVCTNSSEKERTAEQCERSVKDFYSALYIKKFEGCEFEGFVSGVTNFGFFVELDNGVEGLIRLSKLPEYYNFVPKSFLLISDSGKEIRLGQRQKIKVDFVDLNRREIDFKLQK